MRQTQGGRSGGRSGQHAVTQTSVTHHVDEEELRHVAVAQLVALFLERRADRRALLVDARALVGLRLAGPHVSYQLAQPDRHRRRSKTVHAAAKGACGWGKEVVRAERRVHVVKERRMRRRRAILFEADRRRGARRTREVRRRFGARRNCSRCDWWRQSDRPHGVTHAPEDRTSSARR